MGGRKTVFDNYVASIVPDIVHCLKTTLMISSSCMSADERCSVMVDLKNMPNDICLLLRERSKWTIFQRRLMQRFHTLTKCIDGCNLLNAPQKRGTLLWRVNVVLINPELFLSEWKSNVLIAVVNEMERAVQRMHYVYDSVTLQFSDIAELQECYFGHFERPVDGISRILIDAISEFVNKHMPSFEMLCLDEKSMQFQLQYSSLKAE